MDELSGPLRFAGIAGYLGTLGNILFWCVLIYRARTSVLPTEFILFAAGGLFFAVLTLSVALPVEWRLHMLNVVRVAGLVLGIAFTAHTIFALQHRVDMTNETEAERMAAKIDAMQIEMEREPNEARREQMRWVIAKMLETLEELRKADG